MYLVLKRNAMRSRELRRRSVADPGNGGGMQEMSQIQTSRETIRMVVPSFRAETERADHDNIVLEYIRLVS
jgi:hypothetical protein